MLSLPRHALSTAVTNASLAAPVHSPDSPASAVAAAASDLWDFTINDPGWD